MRRRILLTVAILWPIAGAARAELTQWYDQANTSSPTFIGTSFATPTLVDIGAVSGDITYEFIVNGSDTGSAALLGLNNVGLPSGEALKFNQFPDTNTYGATQFGVADYNFGVATTFGSPVVLTFVANSGAGTTTLYVNGVNTGSTVPFAASLSGTVGLGAAYDVTTTSFFDIFVGDILGAAVFDLALDDATILANSNAFFAPAAVPEPSTLALAGLGGLGLLGNGLRRRRRA